MIAASPADEGPARRDGPGVSRTLRAFEPSRLRAPDAIELRFEADPGRTPSEGAEERGPHLRTVRAVAAEEQTEAINLHLAEIGKAVAPGAHAALVLDGAGWHGSAKLAVPDDVTLVKLPPYAPELDPIENV